MVVKTGVGKLRGKMGLSQGGVHTRVVYALEVGYAVKSSFKAEDGVLRKGLKIMNLGDIRTAEGVAAVLQNDDDDDVDQHLEWNRNEAGGDESDEEDEDFVADKDDSGSPTNDFGREYSDANDSGDEQEKPAKKDSKKEPSTSKGSSNRVKSKDAGEDGPKKKKQKKKKDPNAPKKAVSGIMFLSQSERENIKKTNPGIAFTDIAKVLGEKWKKMSAEEKKPYEVKARADKKCYSDQISSYKNPQPMNIDSGNESDSA
ncbi:hypothetical protein Vadar_011319 [Vaccinium darrowii]|uniref:Uncharacterized protein n=1 Tax=Vaccinium darrowii TaxID=229202 RepID=A0ACB7XYQ5_9ERIC|nr:hypothetical protein Vadar_011319 [Vaccinium darrowii]